MRLFANRPWKFLLIAGLALASGAWTPPRDPAPPESPELPRRLQIEPPAPTPSPNGIQPETAAPAAAELYSAWWRVVFQGAPDNHWDIFMSNDDGSGLVQLTSSAGQNVQPRLKRGADRLAFASNRTGDYEIFKANADGSGVTQLTSAAGNDISPYWSPDGNWIAFQSYRDGQSEVYVMHSDGSGQTRLTSDPGYDGQPAWSPDGGRIAFTSYRSGQWRIWVMGVDGSNPVQVSQQAYSADPVWSPDSRRIAYDADADSSGWTELWVMEANGDQPQQVRAVGGTADVLASGWSPDGQRLVTNEVSYILYQGSWYWTSSHICFTAPIAGAFPLSCLSANDTEWEPDVQTLDLIAPVSSMTALPPFSGGEFTINWSGSDVGDGVASYDLQYRLGVNGVWTDWHFGIVQTSIQGGGQNGQIYFYRVRARDRSGNEEAWPATYDATTMTDPVEPETEMGALPPYSTSPFTVTWSGTDVNGSGIDHYLVKVFDNQLLSGIDWLSTGGASAVYADGLPGHNYYFIVHGIDRAGNFETQPGQPVVTTLYDWAADLTARDNRGAPIGGAAMDLLPSPIYLGASNVDGRFSAFSVLHGTPVTYAASWSKTGYGTLNNGVVRSSETLPQEVILPPADDVVANGGFESGSLGAWLPGGTAPAVVTSTLSHLSGYAALAGLPGQNTVTQTLDAGRAYNLRLFQSSDDVLHAVWNRWTGSPTVVYATRPAGGDWSAPVVIGTTPGYSNGFDLAADGVGNVHVVWSGHGAEVYYTHRAPNGTWAAAVSLSAEPSGGPITLKVDDAGKTHLLWQNQQYDVIYQTGTAAGVWSGQEIAIPYEGRLPEHQMVVTPSGTVILIGTDGDGYLFTRRRTGGGWSAPMVVPGSRWAERPQLAATSAGVAYAAWNGPSQQLLVSACTASACWPTPQIFSSSDDFGMAVGPDGALHIVRTAHAAHPQQALYYSRRSPAGVWDPVIKVADDSEAEFVQVAVEPTGQVHVILWSQNHERGMQYAEGTAEGVWTPLRDFGDALVFPVQIVADRNGGGAHILWNGWGTSPDWLVKYQGPEPAKQTATSSLVQRVTIPLTMTVPTLSFMYQAGGLTAARPFSVSVNTGSGPATVFTTTARTHNWTHGWADLSAWAGQSVTVTLGTASVAGQPATYAYVDEVSLGAAHPDTWVSLAGTPTAVAGDLVQYVLHYGNRGGAPSASLALTLQLEPHLQFVSASPAGSRVGQTLSWTTSSLPAGSAAGLITVTTRALPGGPFLSFLNSTANLAVPAAELEAGNNQAVAGPQVVRRLFLPNVRR